MQHLVRFSTAEGRDGQHLADSLDEAVQFVERLRNTEDAQNVMLYRLTPVPIEFKTYYRVEVNASDVAGPVAAVAPAAVAAAPPAAIAAQQVMAPIAPVAAVAPAPVELLGESSAGDELPESAAANGRRLFSRN